MSNGCIQPYRITTSLKRQDLPMKADAVQYGCILICCKRMKAPDDQCQGHVQDGRYSVELKAPADAQRTFLCT